MYQHLFITHATYLRLPRVILVVFHGVSRNKHTWGEARVVWTNRKSESPAASFLFLRL